VKINCASAVSPNFGKTLINQTNIRTKNNGITNAGFVEYDPKDANDSRMMSCIGLYWGENPKDAEHIRRLSSNFERAKYEPEILEGTHFYGLEDQYENTIAIAQVTDKTKGSKRIAEIDYIQTTPDEKYQSGRKRYRGVGETLVAQILQKLTGEADAVELTSLDENFWAASGLFKVKPGADIYPERYIEESDYDKYINHVESKKRPKIYFWG